jgi:hypothetical protein
MRKGVLQHLQSLLTLILVIDMQFKHVSFSMVIFFHGYFFVKKLNMLKNYKNKYIPYNIISGMHVRYTIITVIQIYSDIFISMNCYWLFKK